MCEKRRRKRAAVFGLISSVAVIWTGDTSGLQAARYQPAKLAAMEALYEGGEGVPLTVIGKLNADKRADNDLPVFDFEVKVNKMLSMLAFHDLDAYVPGFKDLIDGNAEHGIMPVKEKMARGKEAIAQIARYSKALREGDRQTADEVVALFDLDTPEGKGFYDDYFRYLGYGYLTSESDIIPPVGLVFYSFRIMVGLGVWFVIVFAGVLILLKKGMINRWRWALWLMLLSLPLPYVAGQAGWIVSEVGRQPWTVQDMLPASASVSDLAPAAVKTTFFIFAVLFTVLLIAEISIMARQIKNGPEAIED